jgi:TonB family protein
MVLAASFVLVAISSVVLIGNFNRQNTDKSISRYEPATEEVYCEEPQLKTDDSLDNMAVNETGREKKIESREPEQIPEQPEPVEQEEITEEIQEQEPESETLVLEELNVVEDDGIDDIVVDDEETLALEIPAESKDTQSEADESMRMADDVDLAGGVSEQTSVSSDSGQENKVLSENTVSRAAKGARTDESGADATISSEAEHPAKIAIDMDAFEEKSEEESEPVSFATVEEKPEFPGGDTAMMNFIAVNTEYPEIARENNIEGRVYITFIIDASGNVTNVSVARGVDPNLDEEAKRVVKLMPAWKPGKQGGQAVAVSYIIPIEFSLD